MSAPSDATIDEETMATSGRRLPPIGGTSSENEFTRRSPISNFPSREHSSILLVEISSESRDVSDNLALLEEHERLNSSLAALTRHFAHVQLRLQQVVHAPTTEDREVALCIERRS